MNDLAIYELHIQDNLTFSRENPSVVKEGWLVSGQENPKN